MTYLVQSWRVGLKVCAFVLLGSFILSPAQAGDDIDWRNDPVRECGSVSVQGGSLVINGRTRLVVGDQALEAELIQEASRTPISLCFLGKWEGRSGQEVFRVTRRD